MAPPNIAQNFVLELSGKPVGRLFGVTGGAIVADVVTTRVGPGNTTRKHISSTRFEPITFTCSTGMSSDFYRWVSDALNSILTRHSGSITMLDTNQKPASQVSFSDAVITSVTLPELDTSSQSRAAITITIAPEVISRGRASGNAGFREYASVLPAPWSVGRFELNIDGLEKECSHVTKVSSLAFNRKVALGYSGDSRLPTTDTTGGEISDIKLSLPEMHSAGFFKWFDDMVINGNTSAEKNGSLAYLPPTGTNPYFKVGISNIGVTSLRGPSAFRGNSNQPVNVDLYCEAMKFEAGNSAIK